MDSLGSCTSPRSMKDALDRLPQGSQALDRAYDDAMNRINDQENDPKELAIKALAWLTYAKRLLNMQELLHALAIEESTSCFDFERLSDAETLLSACAGLAVMDEETDIVRLVHYTTQDYFTQRYRASNVKDNIAIECLTYLTYDYLGEWIPDNEAFYNHLRNISKLGPQLEKYPFYIYAVVYRAQHATESLSQTLMDRVIDSAHDHRKITNAVYNAMALFKNIRFVRDQ